MIKNRVFQHKEARRLPIVNKKTHNNIRLYGNILMWCMIIILTIMSASAIYICSNPIEVSTTCSVLTPSLTCSTYNYSIYDNTSVLIQYDNLTRFSGNIYYFNVTLLEGDYLAVLCDGSSRILTVNNNFNGSNIPIELTINNEQNLNTIILWLLIAVFVIILFVAYMFSWVFLTLSAIPIYFVYIQIAPLLSGNASVIAQFSIYGLMAFLVGIGIVSLFVKKER